MPKPRVLLAFSGGLDSSMSAVLLREQKYDVTLAHFCFTQEAPTHLKTLADKLGFPLIVRDVRQKFNDLVLKYFLDLYASGLTPNPCVFCNPHLKFPLTLSLATELGIELIATGHYAKTTNGQLYRGKNLAKEQSYFLSALPSDILKKTIFPLGEVTDKNLLAQKAESLGLKNYFQEGESQDFCFAHGRTLEQILREYLPENDFKKGKIATTDGKTIGEHSGLPLYTIGQRKGINIGGTGPWYVIAKDAKNNTLIVGTQAETYSDHLTSEILALRTPLVQNQTYLCQLRSRSLPKEAKVTQIANQIQVKFAQPVPHITAGQIIAIYDDDLCLGAGRILPS